LPRALPQALAAGRPVVAYDCDGAAQVCRSGETGYLVPIGHRSELMQRLGDLAANTIVVRNPRITEPDLDQLLAGKYNSLRDYPHLEARLRQRISPAEASIAMQAVLRRDRLEPQARVELFEGIAAYFRSKVEFPPEATDGITDEQYVRNVLDVLYRTRTGPQRQRTREPMAAV